MFRVGSLRLLCGFPLAHFLIPSRERAENRFQAAYAMLVRRKGPGGWYCPEVLVLEPEFPCVLFSFRVFLLRPKL
jgi:hypothetical protein